ncbi:MAG: hypothetical protein CMC96_02675 [Flavobacteriales bacterium]|nr:hypothetical protein [Flavobacteriales bacterium]|tara:strand:- start:4147 stop:5628 length:1482 start_codon:yes stop_codon:yes gene_type:complete
MNTQRLLFISLLFILLASCRKEDEIFDGSSAQLNFSTDSITFDTVFTTIGTSTKYFMVHNPYSETVKISSIRLTGGQQSNFRINVDGRSGNSHQDVEIPPKDSIWVFVEATVDPNNLQNPFVIEDYVEFITNSNRQTVKLVAWGQNAIYYTPTTFSNNLPDYTCLTGPCGDDIPPVNVQWTDSLPIVIYGYVVVDSLDELTIQAGTKVHFHNSAGLWVYSGGKLTVNGTKEEPVIFQGDRLELPYSERPGQWDRIWINEGAQNSINYAIIKNAFIGIQAEVSPFTNPPYDPNTPRYLEIKNTIIDNSASVGLLSSIFTIDAENLLITNSGQHNVVLRSAGDYNFTHCTFANYFDAAKRETPSFFVLNSFVTANATQVIGVPEVQLYNSIVDGDLDNEFDTEVINNGSITFDVQNTLLKTTYNTSNNSEFQNIIKNPSSEIFNDPSNGDFELFEQSVARNGGNINFANQVPLDLNGESRTTDGQPDLGVFEWVE